MTQHILTSWVYYLVMASFRERNIGSVVRNMSPSNNMSECISINSNRYTTPNLCNASSSFACGSGCYYSTPELACPPAHLCAICK